MTSLRLRPHMLKRLGMQECRTLRERFGAAAMLRQPMTLRWPLVLHQCRAVLQEAGQMLHMEPSLSSSSM